jgi:hypothetical protein
MKSECWDMTGIPPPASTLMMDGLMFLGVSGELNCNDLVSPTKLVKNKMKKN